MKKSNLILFVALSAAILIVCSAATGLAGFAGEKETVVGTVTDGYELETTEGVILEVADTDMGNALLTHVGKKAQVVGVITEEEGGMVIRVTSYEIFE